MNCDDFLPALETGGFLRRRAARRHAARCPACARVLAGWEALKAELTATPPLTGRQRDLWTSAARPAGARLRANFAWRAAAFAVAASLVLAALFWTFRDRRFPPVEKTAVTPQVAVVPISRDSVAAELAPLEQRLDRLETELAALSQRAELVDVRRQAATLLEEYRHW